jgi:hypothetical protein
MAPQKAPVDPDDAPLKRLGGGRWQTRDERFTIEPQSGTWVVVDAEQTDDFGLPLVRGPFPSLTSAKEAISGARSAAPAASPLAERVDRGRTPPSTEGPARSGPGARARGDANGAVETRRSTGGAAGSAAKPARAAAASPAAAEEPPAEPGWLRDLRPAERGRARRLITSLAESGVDDPEGIVRRDLVGDVPAIAAHAIGRRLAALDDDTPPADVAELLADGRDEALGVRWRIVDGDGRPILLEPRPRRR